jgi:two-component system, chemotaxis family, chemotaxis protein CheY
MTWPQVSRDKAPGKGRQMILLIDDSHPERAVIRKMLESGGHEVREAGGGDEGLELFAQARPALVICDLMMPHKDGFDTVAEMRKLAPSAKIIAMSGVWFGKSDHAAMAKSLGLVAVIEKPFNSVQLLGLVANTLKPAAKRKPKPKPKPKSKKSKPKKAKPKTKSKAKRKPERR